MCQPSSAEIPGKRWGSNRTSTGVACVSATDPSEAMFICPRRVFQHQNDSQKTDRWYHLCSLLIFSRSAGYSGTGCIFYLGITRSVYVANWFTFKIVLKIPRACGRLPASFVVLRKLVLMEMSHILRACFAHYIAKAETKQKQKKKMYMGRITRPNA